MLLTSASARRGGLEAAIHRGLDWRGQSLQDQQPCSLYWSKVLPVQMNLQPLVVLFKRLLLDLAVKMASKAVDRSLRKQLPQVYEVLDSRLRSEIKGATTPYRVDELIRSSIYSVTGKPATPEDVAAVITLFDPTKLLKL